MAYYDHGAAMVRKNNKEKYKALKEMTYSSPEWRGAFDHIIEMEDEMKENEEKLKEYKQFFSLLRKLLPREHSTLDIIG